MTDDTQDAGTLEVLLKAEWLQKTLDIAKTAGLECILRFGSNGVHARLVDPGNVYLVDIQLDAAAFESLGDGSFPAGVDINRMQDMLTHADSNDVVSLRYDEETRKVGVRYGGRVDNTMSLIDPDSIRNEPDMPDLELPNWMECSCESFRSGIENADLVSDHVWISGEAERDGADTDTIELYSSGDIDDARWVFDDNDLEEYELAQTAETLLSIDYLLDMTKHFPKGNDVRVTFGEEFPIKLEWEYANGHGSVTQTMAPRIQSD